MLNNVTNIANLVRQLPGKQASVTSSWKSFVKPVRPRAYPYQTAIINKPSGTVGENTRCTFVYI